MGKVWEDIVPRMMRPAVWRFPVLTIRGGLSTIEVHPGVSAGLAVERLDTWWKSLTCFGSWNGLDCCNDGRTEGGKDINEDNNLFEVLIASQLSSIHLLSNTRSWAASGSEWVLPCRNIFFGSSFAGQKVFGVNCSVRFVSRKPRNIRTKDEI